MTLKRRPGKSDSPNKEGSHRGKTPSQMCASNIPRTIEENNAAYSTLGIALIGIVFLGAVLMGFSLYDFWLIKEERLKQQVDVSDGTCNDVSETRPKVLVWNPVISDACGKQVGGTTPNKLIRFAHCRRRWSFRKASLQPAAGVVFTNTARKRRVIFVYHVYSLGAPYPMVMKGVSDPTAEFSVTLVHFDLDVVYGQIEAIHLQHVFRVFERLGYQVINGTSNKVDSIKTDWDVLWAHVYPFHQWQDALHSMQTHQKVNHFPGTGYVTTKVSLSTYGGPYIPRAFRIPEDKEALLSYASDHPTKRFLQKDNDHRFIKLKSVSEVNFDAQGSFIQEFISNPLLIDGHKFDIGVYTIITSIDPLRIYRYEGEVLLRFCLEKYHPFNDSNIEQYVIEEDYLPSWEVPGLKQFLDLSYSKKESLDAYLTSKGHDAALMWRQIDEAIMVTYWRRQMLFAKLLSRYKSRRSFFELIRIDFILDENLKVFLLEANMSPNLSSAHYGPNALMYEQILYNLLSLTGISTYSRHTQTQSAAAQSMVASNINLMVYPEVCKSCRNCEDKKCRICKPCLSADSLADLRTAYMEHLNRQRCKRIFPPPMTQDAARQGLPILDLDIAPNDWLMIQWFQGKCLMDSSWCQ